MSSLCVCAAPLWQELADLRALLTLPCPDDLLAYRFLRGHKFDLPVAAKHLQHTLDMRKEVGLDALRVKAEKIEQKQFPFADKVLAVHPHTSEEQRAENTSRLRCVALNGPHICLGMHQTNT